MRKIRRKYFHILKSSASMESRRSAADRRKETAMWSRAVGCLVTLTLSLLAAPLLATAQPLGTLPLVGVLDPGRPHPPGRCLAAFQQGLRDLDYAEGHTIRFAYR